MEFLNNQLDNDYQVILKIINKTYSEQMRKEDFQYFNQHVQYEHYSETLLKQLAKLSEMHPIHPAHVNNSNLNVPFYYSRYVVKLPVKKALHRMPPPLQLLLNKK
ncbi:hypothetical protein [Staphylococcus hyicus]